MVFYEIYVCSWAFLRVVQDKVEIFCELLTLHGMFVSCGLLAISFLTNKTGVCKQFRCGDVLLSTGRITAADMFARLFYAQV